MLNNLASPQDTEENDSEPGGRLLEGTYDETESAASFQEALREWRSEPCSLPRQKNDLWVNPVVDPKTGNNPTMFSCFHCLRLSAHHSSMRNVNTTVGCDIV